MRNTQPDALPATGPDTVLEVGLYQRAFALTLLLVIARRVAPWQSRRRTIKDGFWWPLDCHAAGAARNDKWVRAFAHWY